MQGEDGTKVEYRIWNPFRSKLAAGILGGVDDIWIVSTEYLIHDTYWNCCDVYWNLITLNFPGNYMNPMFSNFKQLYEHLKIPLALSLEDSKNFKQLFHIYSELITAVFIGRFSSHYCDNLSMLFISEPKGTGCACSLLGSCIRNFSFSCIRHCWTSKCLHSW